MRPILYKALERSAGRPAGRDSGRPVGRSAGRTPGRSSGWTVVSGARVVSGAEKKSFDRGGPVWPPRLNAADDRLGGGQSPPQPKTEGSGGAAPPLPTPIFFFQKSNIN